MIIKMTKKDDHVEEIISIYSDHIPDEWELMKKAMRKQTKEKLKGMKKAIIEIVLKEKKEKKKVLLNQPLPLNNKWRKEVILELMLKEKK